MRKFLRSRFEVIATLAVPLLLMGFFGLAMRNVIGDGIAPGGAERGGGNLDYLAYITPGIMAFTSLTAAILGGSTLLTERMTGAIREYLAAPIPRVSILLAAIGSGLAKALVQSTIILLIAVWLGVDLAGGALGLVSAAVAFILYSIGFAAFTVAAAARSPSTEAYHSSITLLNLPLLFASNALYPLEAMPGWLRIASLLNPTTYLIDAMHGGLFGTPAVPGLPIDLLLLAAFALLGVAVAGASLPERGLSY